MGQIAGEVSNPFVPVRLKGERRMLRLDFEDPARKLGHEKGVLGIRGEVVLPDSLRADQQLSLGGAEGRGQELEGIAWG